MNKEEWVIRIFDEETKKPVKMDRYFQGTYEECKKYAIERFNLVNAMCGRYTEIYKKGEESTEE